MTDIPDLNRLTWSQPASVAEFQDLQGFIDAGERCALVAVAPHVRGVPILDIGVGTGRTTSLLLLLSDDYTAVDYTPAMVDACRRNHPEVDVRHGDARHLAELDDGRFGFVMFSFNGIDAMGHDDRARVLAEMRRVLRPGGRLLFSTHNLDGPSHREAPWRDTPFPGPAWYRVLRWTARLPLTAGRHRRRWRNWWRHRHLDVRGDGWSVRTSAPHEFGIVIHYATLQEVRREVADAGLDVVAVLEGSTGTVVGPERRDVTVDVFHVVAQRPVG